MQKGKGGGKKAKEGRERERGDRGREKGLGFFKVLLALFCLKMAMLLFRL